MTGPCMCGDICCPSCGPAQGNWRCPNCRAWDSEGCECTEEMRVLASLAQQKADEEYAKQCIEDMSIEYDWRREAE